MFFPDISEVELPCGKQEKEILKKGPIDTSSMIKRQESNGTVTYVNLKKREVYFENKDEEVFPLDVPIQVDFELTQACNLKCKHCFVTKREAKFSEKTFQAIKELCNKGVISFELIGGEPFLVKEIFDIITYLKKRGKRVSISTNGTLIDKELASKIKTNLPNKIFVSLDGSKKINDEIRGKGSFNKALEGIKNLNKIGIIPSISFCINKLNIDSLKSLVEELNEVRVKNLFLIFGEPTEGNNRFNKYFFSHFQRQEIAKKIRKFNLPIKITMHFESKKNGALYYGCFFRLTICEITPEGDVLSCPIIRRKEGNIFEEDFKIIWKKMQEKLYKNKPVKCSSCKFNNKCFPCEFDIVE